MDPTDVPEPGRLNREGNDTPDVPRLRGDELPEMGAGAALEAEPLTAGEGLHAHHDRVVEPVTPRGPVRRSSSTLPLPAVWLGVLLGILASTLLFLGALVLLALL